MPPRRSSRFSDKRPLSGHKAEGAVNKKLRTPQPKPKKKVSFFSHFWEIGTVINWFQTSPHLI